MPYKRTGRPRGRPRKDTILPDPLRDAKTAGKVARIRELASKGAPPAVIAALVKMPIEKLLKYHGDDMAVGKAEGVEIVLNALFKRVTEGGQKNTIETLFWVKCNAGWAETAAGRAGVVKEEKDGGEGDTKRVEFDFTMGEEEPAKGRKR